MRLPCDARVPQKNLVNRAVVQELAKLKEAGHPDIFLSQRHIESNVLTDHGMILGTLHYMAPEQVEGRVDELDARTDIFAFGAVVYEMATGKKAFSGKSQASVMGLQQLRLSWAKPRHGLRKR